MTKKHFRALAQALNKSKPDETELKSDISIALYSGQWFVCVKEVADMCAEFNPRFNRQKFIEACRFGLNPPKKQELF